MSKTVEFSYEFPYFDRSALWDTIGSFADLAWTGDDPWVFSSDGKTRELPEHGRPRVALNAPPSGFSPSSADRFAQAANSSKDAFGNASKVWTTRGTSRGVLR